MSFRDRSPRVRFRLALPFLLTAALAIGCGGGDSFIVDPDPIIPIPPLNHLPETANAIPAQSLAVGTNVTVDLSQFFRDPDGDTLTYSATSSDTLVAEAGVSGHRLIVVAVSRGAAAIAITASDGRGGEARQSFPVTVSETPRNSPPVPVSEIRSRTIATGSTAIIDVSGYFSDADGDTLTYSATSSDTRVVEVSLSGSELAMVGVSPGVAEATVTARDHEEVEARQSFELTVCAVPLDILHWWSAEGSGADRVGGADAILGGGATYAKGIVGDGGGEAFSFDGVDAIALVPDAPTLNPEGPFTVMAWARTGPVPRPNGAIIGKGHPWAESWVLDTHQDRWRAVIGRSVGTSTTAYGSKIEPLTWTHVAMSWDGQVLALYVDGQPVRTKTVNSINVSDGPVGIGARSEEGFTDNELHLEFEGEIDEVMFFGRALDEEEIKSVIDNTATGFCSP